MSNEINEDLVNAREELQEINEYLAELEHNFNLFDYLPDETCYEMTEEMINDTSEEFKVGSLTYEPGRVLKEIDPVAFYQVMTEYLDSYSEDFRYEFLNNDYSRAYDVIEGLEDKIDRKEELNDIIEELEEELTQDNKSTFKP